MVSTSEIGLSTLVQYEIAVPFGAVLVQSRKIYSTLTLWISVSLSRMT